MFSQLLAEQTSVPALVSFVVLVTVGCVLTIGLTYALIVTAAWRLHRPRPPWITVVFPGAGMLRANLRQYLLAFFTSAVLTVTLAVKHGVVDQVLTYPAGDLVHTHLFDALYPLHSTPQSMSSLPTAEVASYLLPALAAGRDGEVRSVVDTVLQRVLGQRSALGGSVQVVLLAICILLIAEYLAWVIRVQLARLRPREGPSDDVPPELLKHFVTLGLCVALLLASPAIMGDRPQIAEDVVKVLPHYRPPVSSAAVRAAMVAGIDQQTHILAGIIKHDPLKPDLSLVDADDRLSKRIDTLQTSLTTGQQVQDQEILNLREGLKSALSSPASQNQELLIVVSPTQGSYTVTNIATHQSYSEATSGARWLPAGNYLIQGAVVGKVPIRVPLTVGHPFVALLRGPNQDSARGAAPTIR